MAESIRQRLRQLQTATSSVAPTASARTSHSKDSDDARRMRTRRLIQLGALADQYLGTTGATLEQAEDLLRELARLPEVRQAIEEQRRPV